MIDALLRSHWMEMETLPVEPRRSVSIAPAQTRRSQFYPEWWQNGAPEERACLLTETGIFIG
jgi:hypothetical protein